MDNQKLRSRWRKYPRLNVDDIPLEAFGSKRAVKARNGAKCQKFKIDRGDFYLQLLAFKTKLSIELTLGERGGGVGSEQAANAIASEQAGDRIRLVNFEAEELYLDHGINLDGMGPQLLSVVSPTVQILHDHNNHHRRNNWLLAMYGNWLKHEYKSQLLGLLSKPLADQLNSCLID